MEVDLASGFFHDFQCSHLRARDNLIEGILCECEARICDSRYPGLPNFGDAVIAEHHAEDTGGARGVAVRVLAGPRGDLQRLREVSLAVEQAERDVRAVQPRVDVERVERAVGARIVVVPLLLDEPPGRRPVLGFSADHRSTSAMIFA